MTPQAKSIEGGYFSPFIYFLKTKPDQYLSPKTSIPLTSSAFRLIQTKLLEIRNAPAYRLMSQVEMFLQVLEVYEGF